MTEYCWIEDIEEFGRISKEWDEAVRCSSGGSPFLLSDFIATWWNHFCKDSRLMIFVVRDSGKIIGGIPLYLKAGRGIYRFARLLRHIGDSAANYTEPLYASSNINILALLEKALEGRNDWDVLYLTDVRMGNRLVAECDVKSHRTPFRLVLRQDHMNWAVDLSAGLDKYLATVGGKMKRDLRSKRKRAVERWGEISLKTIKGKEEVSRCFDLYTKFSVKAFNSRNRSSNFESERYNKFFRDFLVIMDKNGMLDAHMLLAGSETLAISFAYRFGKGFNWILTGYNYDYRDVRPGYILIEELLKEISRRRETYYNWYGHERFYKAQWCNSQTPLYKFFLTRRTLRGGCYFLLRSAEELARSNKTMVNIARKIQNYAYV